VYFRDLYGSAVMRGIFDDHARLQKWLDYEAALARAQARVGLIPAAAAAEISAQARAEYLDDARIKAGIDKTVHPLVAVIWQLSERCAGEAGGYVHWGATTQDVMDTALILHLKEAWGPLEQALTALIAAGQHLAITYRDSVMAGRTHGQQALPITFGFKAAVWAAELKRHQARLAACRSRVLVGEFGGAVGTLASVADQGLAIQAALMDELGLGIPDIAWHTSRDHLVEFAALLGMIAATLGKIAHEIIDLQKLEFGELEEPFEMGKVGSSTMPQKRNPMLCEAVLTLARLARAQVSSALDSMLHEHERDWSSFQMEWAYLPELCIMTHGAMLLSQRILEGLHVYPQRMQANLNLTRGTLLAERVMLALGRQIGRQQAHDLVYEAAMQAHEQACPFLETLLADPRITAHLNAAELERLLNPADYTGLAGVFVDRVVSRPAP
jgi:adenylosuccinate lyase